MCVIISTSVARTGLAACKACPAGYIQKTSADGATTGATTLAGACTVCTAGKYSETEGSTACQQCPAGRAANASLGDGQSDIHVACNNCTFRAREPVL